MSNYNIFKVLKLERKETIHSAMIAAIVGHNEINKDYVKALEEKGLIVSGYSSDENKYVEIVEIKNHPWFVAVQFNPEFQSRPTRPHPLFANFIKAALANKK